ncbi:MAG: OmpH family outer membrane protein [Flammeovirgaceae bacterium]|nr:OmpH family outer membrane protein [Flammeovirgaceae bacterium]
MKRFSYICRLFFPLGLTLLMAQFSFGQRIGYIESQVIYENLPEYKEALAEIDNLTQNWRKEIDEKQQELNHLTQEFLAEKILLTEKMQEEKLSIIKQKELELREFQNKRFGYKGMLFIKEEQVILPIKEKVAQAVEKTCRMEKAKVDFVFDKSSDLILPYAIGAKDLTKKVLAQLGVEMIEN